MKERRRFPRIDIDLPVSFRILAHSSVSKVSDPIGAKMRDLSLGGVAIETPKIFDNGHYIDYDTGSKHKNMVYLHWQLPGQKIIKVVAETAWQRPEQDALYVAGLKFRHILEPSRKDLQEFLDGKLGGSSSDSISELTDLHTAHIWLSRGIKSKFGDTGIGAVLTTPYGEISKSVCQHIVKTPGHIAEFQTLITALSEAKELGAKKVLLYTDSPGLREWIGASLKGRSPYPKSYENMLRTLLITFKTVEMIAIPPERNQEAERLAQIAVLDSK